MYYTINNTALLKEIIENGKSNLRFIPRYSIKEEIAVVTNHETFKYYSLSYEDNKLKYKAIDPPQKAKDIERKIKSLANEDPDLHIIYHVVLNNSQEEYNKEVETYNNTLKTLKLKADKLSKLKVKFTSKEAEKTFYKFMEVKGKNEKKKLEKMTIPEFQILSVIGTIKDKTTKELYAPINVFSEYVLVNLKALTLIKITPVIKQNELELAGIMGDSQNAPSKAKVELHSTIRVLEKSDLGCILNMLKEMLNLESFTCSVDNSPVHITL